MARANLHIRPHDRPVRQHLLHHLKHTGPDAVWQLQKRQPLSSIHLIGPGLLRPFKLLEPVNVAGRFGHSFDAGHIRLQAGPVCAQGLGPAGFFSQFIKTSISILFFQRVCTHFI